MVIVKMKVSGYYNNRSFVKDEAVEFSEDDLKGLDHRDYEVVMNQKQIEAKAKADAKAKAKAEADKGDEDDDDEDDEEDEKKVEDSSNKMSTGNSKK